MLNETIDSFPQTNWMLLDQGDAANPALEPDTIMIVENKVFVLDAKYYRYGDSKRPDHLQKSTSINKQIRICRKKTAQS